MKKIILKICAAILAVIMVTVIFGCSKTNEESDIGDYTEPPLSDKESDSDDKETSEITESENEITLPDSDELLTNPDIDVESNYDEADDEAAPPLETKPVDDEVESEPERIYNYLNGKTTTIEERDRRPVAIMINNIKNSLPQEGICNGDIYYECAAEGGITRIMMVVSDWEKLGTIGSVRSSRDYFVDFLANHDAIYVHAGGSPLAYAKINYREINNIDGVNMYTPETFWRDKDRLNSMGYEHSLMTSGEGIKSAVDYMKYRTELDKNQVPMLKFFDEDTNNKLVGSPASHIRMESTPIQTVDFVYDKETGEYLRYQYDGMPHVDGTTGEQISVKNVLILFTDISLIPDDEAGRLSVGTVGSGQGYYITNGKRKVVNWFRETKTSTLQLEYRNGDELILNSGKTFICVVDDSVASKIDFEYEW